MASLAMEGLDAVAADVAAGRKMPEQAEKEAHLLCCSAGPSLVRSLERYYFAAMRDASAAQINKRVCARAVKR